jgi:nucleotide-binding universal stress UspA family protein
MSDPRIVIAYDDSAGADSALHDLQCAGVGPRAHVLLVTANVARQAMAHDRAHDDVELDHAHSALVAASGAAELQSINPAWELATELSPGPADEAILLAASRFNADMIVIGWNDRTEKERLWHHSVAHSVLRSAHCSVRIGRSAPGAQADPHRIIIGIDGTPNSCAAIDTVLARHWSAGTTVQVIAAIDAPYMEREIAALLLPEIERERIAARRQELRHVISATVDRLERAGLSAAGDVRVGDPLQILLDAAQSWRAGAIFLGASGAHGGDQSHIASIAFTVAESARCSVEVVRRGEQVPKGPRFEVPKG